MSRPRDDNLTCFCGKKFNSRQKSKKTHQKYINSPRVRLNNHQTKECPFGLSKGF